EEILEAVLLVSQKSYEELKLKFIGNLYANIVVTPSMDRYQANLLLKLAEALSYRQFCLLRFFCLRQPQTKEYFTSDIVAAEVLDLQTKGIIHIPWHLGS